MYRVTYDTSFNDPLIICTCFVTAHQCIVNVITLIVRPSVLLNLLQSILKVFSVSSYVAVYLRAKNFSIDTHKKCIAKFTNIISTGTQHPVLTFMICSCVQLKNICSKSTAKGFDQHACILLRPWLTLNIFIPTGWKKASRKFKLVFVTTKTDTLCNRYVTHNIHDFNYAVKCIIKATSFVCITELQCELLNLKANYFFTVSQVKHLPDLFTFSSFFNIFQLFI